MRLSTPPLNAARPLRRCILVASGCVAAGLAAVASGHGGKAHMHDVAEAQVAVDGETLRIALASPLANLVGFERAPRTDAERDAVRRMAATLRETAKLYVPNAEARCAPVGVVLSSAVLEPALLGEATPSPGAKPAAAPADHGDLDAITTFRCATPAQLRAVDFHLMQAFPKLRRVDVQVAGPTRQSMMRLTADRRSVPVR